ncbi:universal stress protein [Kocuria flava]|uniref:universal stress protein n=1 Tax=Kocuria flava TaxID=446860 RepID=UPI000C7B2997|nr:universal stress protein [Kocuria flava]
MTDRSSRDRDRERRRGPGRPEDASTGSTAGDAPDVTGEIVVGIDGSEQSLGALRWAAREGRRRGLPVRMVTAYSLPVFSGSGFDTGYATVDEAALARGVEELLNDAAAQVRSTGVELRATVETGDPSGALLELSRTAELLVLGSRGRGGLLGRLLGTVSTAVPAHAKCPTGVVPLPWSKEHLGEEALAGTAALVERVVVGSDGSSQARAAMLEAAEEARLLDVPLTVVCAVPPVSGAVAWMPTAVDFEAMYDDVARALQGGVAWLKSWFPDLEIGSELADGPPVQVLVDQTRRNRLVVVGTRGRGGFAGMLLGSTSQGVLHNAAGPVLIVPDRYDERIETRKDFDLDDVRPWDA